MALPCREKQFLCHQGSRCNGQSDGEPPSYTFMATAGCMYQVENLLELHGRFSVRRDQTAMGPRAQRRIRPGRQDPARHKAKGSEAKIVWGKVTVVSSWNVKLAA